MGKAFGQLREFTSEQLVVIDRQIARYRTAYAYPTRWDKAEVRRAATLLAQDNGQHLYQVAARVWSRANYLGDREQDDASSLTASEQEEVRYLSAFADELRNAAARLGADADHKFVQVIIYAANEMRRREQEFRAGEVPVTEPSPYVMGEGDVQGSFLLPGGSTLTAEQVRLKRLNEYADSLTGEAKARAKEFITFYQTLYNPSAGSSRWSDVPTGFLYVGTMMCPRPDPLGRFILCDIMYNPGTTRLRVYLAGAMKAGSLGRGVGGLLLGDGYSENRLYKIGQDDYARSHTPGGVVIKRVGLGTVLYSAHALAAAVYRGAAGCYSDGGSESANAWWQDAIDRGFAEGDESREPEEREHCESISDRDTGDGGWIVDSEVCASVTVEFGGEGGIRYLPVNNVMDSELLAFGVLKRPIFVESVQFPVTENHRPFWDRFGTLPTSSDTEYSEIDMYDENLFVEGKGSPYKRVGDKVQMDLPETTAELLARSFHGQSPVLAASILAALANKYPEQAIVYATRPDIAPLLAGNETLRRLVETQRLPGLSGLSKVQHTALAKAVHLAGLGQATVDVGEKNPLNLKPVSAKTKKLLDQFKDMD